ncbi:hypothetical protein ABZ845_11800 [Streptomyces sp. NPDC047022]|uniref:prealbumin-like fold domain-containing protein n=1 Tax=Streptomyces sp. NPDC047022 TaxID=3155737 RepID=UPI0033E5FF6C
MPALALMMSTGSALAAPAQVPGQGSPLACTNGTIYAIQRGDTDSVLYAVDTTTINSATVLDTPVATLPGETVPNALGISPGGAAAYTVHQLTGPSDTTVPLYAYNPLTQTWTTYTGTAGPNQNLIAGAVDPANGIYYYADYSSGTALIYGFDTATNTAIPGIIATVPLPIPGGFNGDIAFDAAGNLYLLGGTTTTAGITVVPGPLPTTGSATGTPLQGKLLQTVNGFQFNGIAFDNSGNLFLNFTQPSDPNSYLEEVNPNTGAVIAGPTPHSATGQPLVDLGACSLNPSLTLQKDIVKRAERRDQFMLSITGDDLPPTTATTTGKTTGLQPVIAGPAIGHAGTTYTFTETAVSGDLDNYRTSYTCVEKPSGTVIAHGKGDSFTLTLPAAATPGPSVVCTFKNKAERNHGKHHHRKPKRCHGRRELRCREH